MRYKFLFLILPVFFLFFFAGKIEADTPWEKITDSKKLPYLGLELQEEKEMLLVSINESLSYLKRNASKHHFPKNGITHEMVLKSLERFKKLLEKGLLGKELDAALKKEFDIYRSIGKSSTKKVLFTGYFVPIYEGSRLQTKEFKYPIYRTPPDLALDAKGKVLGRKTKDGIIPKYWTRQDIDRAKKLKGLNLEIVYLKNPYQVYMAQFQGSAAIKLPEGEVIYLGYAARNHSTIGFSLPMELYHQGVLEKHQLLPHLIKAYFDQYPEKLEKYLVNNSSYVFFTERKKAPLGALSVQLTPETSISTDHTCFPKASLAFVDLKFYKNKMNHPFRHFVLNQDTGGGIQGPGRCEIFFGIGERAEEKASEMYAEGQLYFLFLKKP